MAQRQRQTEPEPDPLAWLAEVYRLVADDDPDDAGQWLNQLEGWLSEVRQKMAEGERKYPRQPVACEVGQTASGRGIG
jgi:hypothetical protein